MTSLIRHDQTRDVRMLGGCDSCMLRVMGAADRCFLNALKWRQLRSLNQLNQFIVLLGHINKFDGNNTLCR